MKQLKPFSLKIRAKQRFQRILDGSCLSVNLKSGAVVLKPRQEIGEHVTEGKEELLIILKGKAKIALAGAKSITAGKGSVVYIPPQTAHNVVNLGRSPLHYIYVVAPVLGHLST